MKALLLRPWMAVFALVAGLAGSQVWLSHLRYEMSLESQRLQSEKQDVLKQAGNLRLELASLSRPERLREMATKQLHMAPPAPMQVVHP